jgi:hypothetical protein
MTHRDDIDCVVLRAVDWRDPGGAAAQRDAENPNELIPMSSIVPNELYCHESARGAY